MRYKSTTGLDDDQTLELVARIADILKPHTTHHGRPTLLGLYRHVELVLVLARHDLTQMTAGDLFGVSQPTTSRIWRHVLPLMEEAAGMSETGLSEAIRNRSVLVDGTYVPTGNRAATGHTNYSGKRHCQCLSIQVACGLDATLLAVSDPVAGARHDAYAIRAAGWQDLLAGTCWIADTACRGAGAITPIQKTPGRDRLDWEKQFTHDISSLRAPVERSIAHLKNWQILSHGYHGPLHELPAIIHIITNLEQYRLGW